MRLKLINTVNVIGLFLCSMNVWLGLAAGRQTKVPSAIIIRVLDTQYLKLHVNLPGDMMYKNVRVGTQKKHDLKSLPVAL